MPKAVPSTVSDGKRPILIYFYARNCRQCREYESVFDSNFVKLAAAGATCFRLEINKHKDLARMYGVKSHPAVVLIDYLGKWVAANKMPGDRALASTMKQARDVRIESVFGHPSMPSLDWEENYKKGIIRARENKKPVLLYFYRPNHSGCREVAKLFRKAKVRIHARRFVAIRINGRARRDLLKKYGVVRCSTMLFLDANGKLIGGAEHDALLEHMDGIIQEANDIHLQRENSE